jgi:hypothetical protein
MHAAHARARLDREAGGVGAAVLPEVAREAADAVAAHGRLRTVRVEDTHAVVGFVRRLHHQQPVCPHPESAIAQPTRQRREIVLRQWLRERVQQHEVVACALQFIETQRGHSSKSDSACCDGCRPAGP